MVGGIRRMTFIRGNTATVTVQWTQAGGGPVDVTDQTVTITLLAGAVVIVDADDDITHVATGLYTYQWAISPAAETGDYAVVWDATSGSDDVQTSEIVTVVSAQILTGWKPAYASLDLMHDWLRLRGELDDTEDDALLTLALSASSRAVDAACGRQFGKALTAVTRTYPMRWSRTLRAHVADIDDLIDLTGLTVSTDDGATTLTTDQYKLRPRNADADAMVYTYIVITHGVGGCGCGCGYPFGSPCHLELTMSAPWGWNAFPDPVVQATLLQTSRLNIRRDSPYGIAGGPDSGTEMRLLERLDPDIAPIVTNYVRLGWVSR